MCVCVCTSLHVRGGPDSELYRNPVTLSRCVLAATPQHCHGDPKKGLHHACQNITGLRRHFVSQR